jgi:hypothetical protein
VITAVGDPGETGNLFFNNFSAQGYFFNVPTIFGSAGGVWGGIAAGAANFLVGGPTLGLMTNFIRQSDGFYTNAFGNFTLDGASMARLL